MRLFGWICLVCFGLGAHQLHAQNACYEIRDTGAEWRAFLGGVHALAGDGLEQTLSRILLEEAYRRRTTGSTLGVYGDVSDVAADVRAWLENDSTARPKVAAALAGIMVGELRGSNSDQALIAARLYDEWGMPFDPIAAMLKSPHASIRARINAVQALRKYWPLQRYAETAVVAFCDLAARAEGLRVIREDRDAIPLAGLLNGEEWEFMSLLRSSVRPGNHFDHIVDRLEKAFPKNNPVTSELRASVR